MRSIILQPILNQPAKRTTKIFPNLAQLKLSANHPSSNLLEKKTQLPNLKAHQHEDSSSKVNTKHRRYKTDHRSSILNPQKLVSTTNSKSFDDLVMKDANYIFHYETLQHSRNRRKVRLNNKKFSYCVPIKTKHPKVRRISPGQLQIERQQRLSLLIPRSQFQQTRRQSDKQIMFNPQIWKSHEFDKILRQRIKLLLKNRQGYANIRHDHSDLYK